MSFSWPVRRITIVGTGVIGASWATLYLAKGFEVTATDPAANAESNLRRYVDKAWRTMTALGLSAKASREHLYFTKDLGKALANADFVQENAPDQRGLKTKLFADMDSATPSDSIIASSSSALTMSDMQSACAHPERCVIGRPLNPPHIIPLVEVAGGKRTSPEAVQQAISFYASFGRKPILVRKEVVGHVAHRLQAALYRELIYLIDQDALDVASADAAVSWGPGLLWGVMGPNLLHHIGGDVAGIESFMERFADSMTHSGKTLGNAELTPRLVQVIIDGVLQLAGRRSVEQLTRERDEVLLGLIRLRRKHMTTPNARSRAARKTTNR